MKTIYLDVDEVLKDFVGGFCDFHGVKLDRLKAEGKWNPGSEWGLDSLIANELGTQVSELWNSLTMEFWKDLKPFPWTDKLLDLVKTFCKYNDFDLVLCTSVPISKTAEAIEGKLASLIDYKIPIQFCYNEPKIQNAGRTKILIDDRTETINKFIRKGGRGILFPAYHNERSSILTPPEKEDVTSVVLRYIINILEIMNSEIKDKPTLLPTH